MYLDRHDSREDLSTKIYRRHDPVGGPRCSLKRFRDASIPSEMNLLMGNPGVNEFSTRLSSWSKGTRSKRVRVRKCKFLCCWMIQTYARRRGRGSDSSRTSLQRRGSESSRVPLLSPRDPSRMHQAVQPVPTYLAWEFLACIQRETFTSLANDSARLYHARTLISPLPSRNSERKMNSLAVPTSADSSSDNNQPAQYVAECNCGSVSAILWPGCIALTVEREREKESEREREREREIATRDSPRPHASRSLIGGLCVTRKVICVTKLGTACWNRGVSHPGFPDYSSTRVRQEFLSCIAALALSQRERGIHECKSRVVSSITTGGVLRLLHIPRLSR